MASLARPAIRSAPPATASAARSAPNSPRWRIEPAARFSTQALPLMTIRERRRARSMKLRGSERTPWQVYSGGRIAGTQGPVKGRSGARK